MIRFPNGDYEYDLRRGAALTIGDTIRRRGVLWSVRTITPDFVPTLHVERVNAPVAESVQEVAPGEWNAVDDRARELEE